MDQGKPNWDLLWTNNLLIIDVFLVLIPKWAKLVGYFRPLTHEHSFCKIYLFETLSVILYCLYNLKTLKTPTEEWGEKKFGKRNDSGIFNTTGAYPWLWKKKYGQKGKQQYGLRLRNLHVHEVTKLWNSVYSSSSRKDLW